MYILREGWIGDGEDTARRGRGTSGGGDAYAEVEESVRDAYPWVPVPDDAWEIVTSVRRELATQSAHNGLSVADHLVVATAIRLKLTVLHEDTDFETVARIVPQLKQERISAN